MAWHDNLDVGPVLIDFAAFYAREIFAPGNEGVRASLGTTRRTNFETSENTIK
jgi:hypothetical protein